MKLHLPVKLRASLIAAVIAVTAGMYNAAYADDIALPSGDYTTNDVTLNGEVTAGNNYTANKVQKATYTYSYTVQVADDPDDPNSATHEETRTATAECTWTEALGYTYIAELGDNQAYQVTPGDANFAFVPDEYYDTTDAKGHIALTAATVTQSVISSVANGDITITDSTVSGAESSVTTNAGTVRIDLSSVADGARVSTGSGNVHIATSTISGGSTVSTASGDVLISKEGVSYRNTSDSDKAGSCGGFDAKLSDLTAGTTLSSIFVQGRPGNDSSSSGDANYARPGVCLSIFAEGNDTPIATSSAITFHHNLAFNEFEFATPVTGLNPAATYKFRFTDADGNVIGLGISLKTGLTSSVTVPRGTDGTLLNANASGWGLIVLVNDATPEITASTVKTEDGTMRLELADVSGAVVEDAYKKSVLSASGVVDIVSSTITASDIASTGNQIHVTDSIVQGAVNGDAYVKSVIEAARASTITDSTLTGVDFTVKNSGGKLAVSDSTISGVQNGEAYVRSTLTGGGDQASSIADSTLTGTDVTITSSNLSLDGDTPTGNIADGTAVFTNNLIATTVNVQNGALSNMWDTKFTGGVLNGEYVRGSLTAKNGSIISKSFITGSDITITAGGLSLEGGGAVTGDVRITLNSISTDHVLEITGDTTFALDGAARTAGARDASLTATALKVTDAANDHVTISNAEVNVRDSTYLKAGQAITFSNVNGGVDGTGAVQSAYIGNILNRPLATGNVSAATINITGASYMSANHIYAGETTTEWSLRFFNQVNVGGDSVLNVDEKTNEGYYVTIKNLTVGQADETTTAGVWEGAGLDTAADGMGSKVYFKHAEIQNATINGNGLYAMSTSGLTGTMVQITEDGDIGNLTLTNEGVLNLVHTTGQTTSHIANITANATGTINVIDETLETPELSSATLSLGLNNGIVQLVTVAAIDGANVASAAPAVNPHVSLRKITNGSIGNAQAENREPSGNAIQAEDVPYLTDVLKETVDYHNTIKTTLTNVVTADWDGTDATLATKTDGIASLMLAQNMDSDATYIRAYETATAGVKDGASGKITINGVISGQDNVLVGENEVYAGGIVTNELRSGSTTLIDPDYMNRNTLLSVHKNVTVGTDGIVGSENRLIAMDGDVIVQGDTWGHGNEMESHEGYIQIDSNFTGTKASLLANNTNLITAEETINIDGALAGYGTTVTSYSTIKNTDQGEAAGPTNEAAITVGTFAAQETHLGISTAYSPIYGEYHQGGSILIEKMVAAQEMKVDTDGNLHLGAAEVDATLMNTITTQEGNVTIEKMDGSNAYTTITTGTGDVIIGLDTDDTTDTRHTGSNLTFEVGGDMIIASTYVDTDATHVNAEDKLNALTLTDSVIHVKGDLTGSSLTLTTSAGQTDPSKFDSTVGGKVTLDALTLGGLAKLDAAGGVDVGVLTLIDGAHFDGGAVDTEQLVVKTDSVYESGTLTGIKELTITGNENGTGSKVTVNGDLSLVDAAGQLGNLTLEDGSTLAAGSITTSGNIKLLESSDILAGNILSAADVTLTGTAADKAEAKDIAMSGTLDADYAKAGAITGASVVDAANSTLGDITMKAKETNEATGSRDVTLNHSGSGAIANANDVTLTDSTVDGNIGMDGVFDATSSTITGNVTGASSATLTGSDLTGDITTSGKLTVTDGEVHGDVLSATDVELTEAEVDDVTMTGELTATDATMGNVSGATAGTITGTVDVTSLSTGDLCVATTGSTLTGTGDIAADGLLDIRGAVTSTAGSISLTGMSEQGIDSSITNDVTAEGMVTLDGTIYVDGGDIIARNSAVDLVDSATITAADSTLGGVEGLIVDGILNAGKGAAVKGTLTGTVLDSEINKTGGDTLAIGGDTAYVGTINVADASTLSAGDGASVGAINLSEGSTLEVATADGATGAIYAGVVTATAADTIKADLSLSSARRAAATVTADVIVAACHDYNGATLELTSTAPLGESAVEDQTRVLVAEGTVLSSVNEDVVHNLDTLNVHAEDMGDHIDAVLSKNYKGISKTENQAQTADALSSVNVEEVQGTELGDVLDALAHTRSAGASAAALDKLSGRGIAGLQKLIADDTHEHMQTLRSTLESAAAGVRRRYDAQGNRIEGVQSSAVTGTVTGGTTEVDGTHNCGDYSRNSVGFMLAGVHAVSSEWVFGADFAYSFIDGECSESSFSGDAVYFDIAMMQRHGRFSQMGTLGAGIFRFDADRHVNISAKGHDYSGFATGSTNAAAINLAYEANYDLMVKDQHAFTTVAMVEATFAQIDAMTEEGLGNAGLRSEFDDVASLTIGMGGRYTYSFGEENNPGYVLAEAMLVVNTGDDMAMATNQFIGGGTSFNVAGPESGDVGLRLNAGALVPFADVWGVFGNVTAEFREEQSSVGGSIGVKYAF